MRKPETSINIAPLVDVMLVLLIIFIVTAPMIQVGIQVDLPKTKATSIVSQNKPVVVTLKSNKMLYLQDRIVTFANLKQKLGLLTMGKKSTIIQVKADKKLAYEEVYKLINALIEDGYSRISLVAEAK